MFIRLKKVKGKEYSYLVENFWSEKGSRQRVKEYLGKAIRLGNSERKTIIEETKDFANTVRESVKRELIEREFVEKEGLLKKEEICVDLFKNKITENNKKAVLVLNEGFLCENTLKELSCFTPQGSNAERGKRLANLLLEAGIKLSNEEFIKLCDKIIKEELQEEASKNEKEEFYY